MWRIREYYLKDATGSPIDETFWNKLAEDKENHIKELEAKIKEHLK